MDLDGLFVQLKYIDSGLLNQFDLLDADLRVLLGEHVDDRELALAVDAADVAGLVLVEDVAADEESGTATLCDGGGNLRVLLREVESERHRKRQIRILRTSKLDLLLLRQLIISEQLWLSRLPRADFYLRGHVLLHHEWDRLEVLPDHHANSVDLVV